MSSDYHMPTLVFLCVCVCVLYNSVSTLGVVCQFVQAGVLISALSYSAFHFHLVSVVAHSYKPSIGHLGQEDHEFKAIPCNITTHKITCMSTKGVESIEVS